MWAYLRLVLVVARGGAFEDSFDGSSDGMKIELSLVGSYYDILER